MSELLYEKKLETVRNLCEKHKITAYEIGDATQLDISGVQRILSGETKKPREVTLNKILIYLENKIVGIDIDTSKFNEPQAEYNDKILTAIEELKAIMRRDHDAIAEGVRATFLNTETSKKQGQAIIELLEAIRS